MEMTGKRESGSSGGGWNAGGDRSPNLEQRRLTVLELRIGMLSECIDGV
jgi:hypothetical protein